MWHPVAAEKRQDTPAHVYLKAPLAGEEVLHCLKYDLFVGRFVTARSDLEHFDLVEGALRGPVKAPKGKDRYHQTCKVNDKGVCRQKPALRHSQR